MNPIRLIVYDFDGVLTDNRVWVTQDGQESVACNRSDGWWIGEIKKLNIPQLILSTEINPVVSARAKKLGIEAIQGQKNKFQALKTLLEEKGMELSQVLYIGNEMNDLECIQNAGVSMAPQDSHPTLLKMVTWVIPEKGGYGIVRHLYDWLQNASSR